MPQNCITRHLRARMALSLFNDVPLRTTKAHSLYKVYCNSALLVINEPYLNSINALLVLSRRTNFIHTPGLYWNALKIVLMIHL